jgi:hypothetical protein
MVLWHAFLFLGLRFFLPFFLFLAWWPPLLSLLRNFISLGFFAIYTEIRIRDIAGTLHLTMSSRIVGGLRDAVACLPFPRAEVFPSFIYSLFMLGGFHCFLL